MNDFNFSVKDFEKEEAAFRLLPAGQYGLRIDDAVIRVNQKLNGEYLRLMLTVVDPEEYKEKSFYIAITTQHDNAYAEHLGKKELATLLKAMQKQSISKVEDLLKGKFVAYVDIRERNQRKENFILQYIIPRNKQESPPEEDDEEEKKDASRYAEVSKMVKSTTSKWKMKNSGSSKNGEDSGEIDIPF